MSRRSGTNRDCDMQKKINLSSMSDEEIQNFMDSVESEEEFEDHDDSVEDPNYVPDASDYVFDELEPEVNQMISDCLPLLDTSTMINAVNYSIDISNLSLFEQQQELPSTSTQHEQQQLPTTSNANVDTTESIPEQNEPQTEATTSFKPKKRARSPLPTVEASGPLIVPSAGGFTGGDLANINKDSTEFKGILWRKRCMQLHVNEVAFRGKVDLPSEVKKLQTPFDFFSHFFTDDIIDLISLETNRAAITENVNTHFKIDKHGIRRYIGVLIFMSIFRYPSIEAHWGEFGFRNIPDCMSKNRFEQIKKYLSFNDESERVQKGQPGYDPIFRIRKVATCLVERFDSIPKNARLCIDEQMCSTKMVHHLRQYLPDKPHKWGVKLFVLCDTNGYSYRFEIYTGARNDDIILPDSPNIGATGNVVIRLSQTVPNFMNHILYFDNFYTSLPLMVYLRARGIFSLGTVRANRIPNCKLPTDKSEELKNAERGYSTEFVGSAYGVEMTTVLWRDTKNVKLCSTYVGTKAFLRTNSESQPSKVARYNRKEKSYIDVECPQIIREYNAHMGGVDLMDSYMGRNGLQIKTQDMATRIFYHLLDMAITNAFILYRRRNAELNRSDQDDDEKLKDMTMCEFRLSIAKELCASVEKRVGRPSSRMSIEPSTSSIGKKTAHPVASMRFDGLNHVPEWGSKKSCKLCKKSDTHTFCAKCNIHLCFSKAKNCFKMYHVNE